MLCIKKFYNNDLLQLALVLSLLRLDFSLYFNQHNPWIIPTRNITDIESDLHRNTNNIVPNSFSPEYVNPKNLDNILLNYERQLFEELNSLGRYHPIRSAPYNISAYLLNVERDIHNVGSLGHSESEQTELSTSFDDPVTNLLDSGIENEDATSDDSEIVSNAPLQLSDIEEIPERELEPELGRTLDTDEFLTNNPLLNELPKDLFDDASETVSNDVKIDNFKNSVDSPTFNNTILDEDEDETPLTGALFENDNLLDELPMLPFTNVTNVTMPKVDEHVPDNIFSESLDSFEETASPLIGELTQEDMDLIEVLWKQDVDLGFSLETETEVEDVKVDSTDKPDDLPKISKISLSDDSAEYAQTAEFEKKLKALEAFGEDNLKIENSGDESNDVDPWAGLQYTVDTETGEYVLKDGLDTSLTSGDCDNSIPLPPLDDLDSFPLSLPDLFFDDSIAISEFDESTKNLYDSDLRPDEPLLKVFDSVDSSSVASTSTQQDPGTTDEEDFLAMIQTAQFHSPHPHAFQGHMNPYVRMNEQRWQDVAGLLTDTHNSTAGAVLPASSHHAHHPAFSAHAAHHAVAALHNLSHPHMHHGHPGHPHMGAYGADTRGVLTHNVTLGSTMQETHHHGVTPFSNISGTNLGSAVATSINLTSTAESVDSGATASYKMENPSHDIMYFPNSSSEISNATDGFLSSILNEDLQLMDMMGDDMYSMRMLDGNGTSLGATGRMDMAAAAAAASERMDASSDSAVSSMGSERVASLSDNEWGDATSDSGHTAGDHYVLDYASKYRPYDYSYSNRQQTANAGGIFGSDSRRMSSVAQKKHHMFGKRFFQDQTSNATSNMKYDYGTTPSTPIDIRQGQPIGSSVRPKAPEAKFPCAMEHPGHIHTGRTPLDHVHHNHTYNLPPESTGTMQRPIFRDKAKGKNDDEPHLTRDEKRARALNVPLSVDDIINLPMDEFNERLSKFDLSEPQLSLIRDIRRRGKNKVAAQNCRKRKLDQILSLADEVKDMRDRKNRLMAEREFMIGERQRVKEKFTQLYRHVFRNLRDPDGNPYSSNLYSLQQSADGTVIVVPKGNVTDPKEKKPTQ